MPGGITSEVADSGVFTGLAAGSWQLIITDASGCLKDTTIIIAHCPPLC
jgi:hypothetical protein